ncbi:hypothetical protein QQF64_020260 [Cirrhinus molitorella]|uniref:Transposase n=1 Tax=Cirrhinus molitorella TaxID=172907 RepID=A0ABR3LA57_9TELE
MKLQEPIILQCCHIPQLQPTWSVKKYEVFSSQRHGQGKKAETRPPLNKTHKVKRQEWAKKYLKTDFSKVLWTDEMRVTLDGPDGWARGWFSNGHRAPL